MEFVVNGQIFTDYQEALKAERDYKLELERKSRVKDVMQNTKAVRLDMIGKPTPPAFVVVVKEDSGYLCDALRESYLPSQYSLSGGTSGSLEARKVYDFKELEDVELRSVTDKVVDILTNKKEYLKKLSANLYSYFDEKRGSTYLIYYEGFDEDFGGDADLLGDIFQGVLSRFF